MAWLAALPGELLGHILSYLSVPQLFPLFLLDKPTHHAVTSSTVWFEQCRNFHYTTTTPDTYMIRPPDNNNVHNTSDPTSATTTTGGCVATVLHADSTPDWCSTLRRGRFWDTGKPAKPCYEVRYLGQGFRWVELDSKNEAIIYAGATSGHVFECDLTRMPYRERVEIGYEDEASAGVTALRDRHNGWVRCVRKRDDRLFSCGTDEMIGIWSVAEQMRLATIEVGSDINLIQVTDMLQPYGLLSGSDDCELCLWDLERSVRVTTCPHPTLVLAFDHTDQVIISGDMTGLFMWDLRHAKQQSVALHLKTVRVVHMDGFNVFIAGSDLFELRDQRKLSTVVQAQPIYKNVIWNAHMAGIDKIVTAGDNGVCRYSLSQLLYDPITTHATAGSRRSEAHLFTLGSGTAWQSVTFGSDHIVAASTNGYMTVWSP
eukprot:TRINITY_DN15159_c0_g1_i1.p1 TRINITY_DN15159_c0_g1~~TRINITY_DN15159_c0_g1_i1.p1  ORF type:complete len:429 (+),score=54.91 TRINITY_DN15159_c0_g1_i1:51-1337(+)